MPSPGPRAISCHAMRPAPHYIICSVLSHIAHFARLKRGRYISLPKNSGVMQTITTRGREIASPLKETKGRRPPPTTGDNEIQNADNGIINRIAEYKSLDTHICPSTTKKPSSPGQQEKNQTACCRKREHTTMHPDMRGSLIFTFPGVAHFIQLAKPLIFVLRQGKASQAARQGKATASQRQCKARQVKAGQCNAMQGKATARQAKAAHCKARQARRRHGKARQGQAMQGKVTQCKATARQGLLLFFFPIGTLTQPRPPPEMRHGLTPRRKSKVDHKSTTTAAAHGNNVYAT